MNKRIQLIAVLLVIFLFSIQLLMFDSYQSIFPNLDENDNYYLDKSEIAEENDDEDDDTKSIKEDPPSRTLESYNSGKTAIENEMEERNHNSQNQSSPSSISVNIPNSSSTSSLNLNILNQNQLVDVISLEISQAYNIEKDKIKQALFDLIEITQTKNGDVLKPLRQIATSIINDPFDPISDKIIGIVKQNELTLTIN
jgi:hypothetical protein